MNPKYYLLAALAALSLGGCSTDDTVTDTVPEPEKGGYKISFTVAEDSETRTTLETLGETNVMRWVPTDKVGIYTVGKNTNANTVTVADVNQSPVEFIGILDNLVSKGDMFYAYYPYNAEQSTEPTNVKLTIPTEQTQTKVGEYNGQSHPLVALPMAIEWEKESYAGRITSARFRLLGAIVELKIFSSDETLRKEKIQSVTFKSESAVAGDFTFDLTGVTVDKEPQISGYELTEVTTTLTEESADIPATKEAAALVYLTIAPGTYTGEFVVETDIARYTFTLAEAMEFNRAVIKGLPADLAAAKCEVKDLDAPIPFADPEVKRICVNNWDTSGDKELSYGEAAAVTSLVDDYGESLFYRNTSIRSFNELRYFTKLTAIEGAAFYDCSSLKSITIPAGVTAIKYSAFYGCSKLTSIHIPNGVTEIGENAFDDCSSLTSIHIPDGVTSIGYSAFSGCSSLTSITIPQTVTTIGTNVFDGCSALSAFYGEKASDDHRCLILNGTLLVFAPAGQTEYTIPAGVTSIGDYAFNGCKSLTSITIPEGVTSIGNYAFYNCKGLTSITIPAGVTSIGGYAFWNCSGLTSINISDGVKEIGDNAFYYCSKLTSITIPQSVSSIGTSVFYGCSALSTFKGAYASADNHCLIKDGTLLVFAPAGPTTYTIPDKVTSIGGYAFNGCGNLTNITIPAGVNSIENYAFQNCSGLTSITIPETMTTIGSGAFSYCSNLTSIHIPDGVTSIGGYAFWMCSSLTSVNIPEGVTMIESSTFQDCSRLESITIPEGVTSIGGWVFNGCSKLTSVYCKRTTPPTLENSNAFNRTPESLQIYVPANSVKAYQDANNWNKYASKIVEETINVSPAGE